MSQQARKMRKVLVPTSENLGTSVDPELQADLNIHAQFYEKLYVQKASVTALSPSALRSLLPVTTGLKGLDMTSSKLLPKSTQIERSQSWQP